MNLIDQRNFRIKSIHFYHTYPFRMKVQDRIVLNKIKIFLKNTISYFNDFKVKTI